MAKGESTAIDVGLSAEATISEIEIEPIPGGLGVASRAQIEIQIAPDQALDLMMRLAGAVAPAQREGG